MAAIGSGWVDGAWIQAGWVTEAWAEAGVDATIQGMEATAFRRRRKIITSNPSRNRKKRNFPGYNA